MEDKIREMCHVTMSLNALDNSTDATAHGSVQLRFIHGLATDGLTPFESALSDKQRGDEIEVSLDGYSARLYFGYLLPAVKNVLHGITPGSQLHLKMRVTGVRVADNHEVVKAMASQISHCGSGDCGCGCS